MMLNKSDCKNQETYDSMSLAQKNIQARRSPNIVLILTDDQGWGDLSLHGNTNLSTPRIDALAHQGAMFEWFYVQPLCAPTRAEILTGRYFARTGVSGVTRKAEYMNLDETTLADVFKKAGYTTGCFGKWHNGSPYPYHPNARGFDEFYGFCSGHWSYYFDSTLEHNGQEIKANGYIIDYLTQQAMNFMEVNQSRPFLCYVPFNTPHIPYQIPDLWFDKFKDREIGLHHFNIDMEDPEAIRTVLAMCENIDWNVGRLVDKIEELGLIEDTIFVYLSDNGPFGVRWNGNMRGAKGRTDEGGVRVPCIFNWKGRIPPNKKISEIAGAVDLLPTLADIADVEIKENKALDGISLKTLLMREENHCSNININNDNENEFLKETERYLVSQSSDMKYTSIRTQSYRFGGHTQGLYEVAKDIGQDHDLSLTLPKLTDKLQTVVNKWREEVIPKEHIDHNIPVGYKEFPTTYLNAQDANPTGGITWSSVHPNVSYFINWLNTASDMTWDIDVHNSGDYEVTLLYTCKAGDEGSHLVVECGDVKVDAILTEPFDPPLKTYGYRVKEVVESYDKEFKPLFFGTFHLEPGIQQLRLFANTIAASEVCHVRAIKLMLKM